MGAHNPRLKEKHAETVWDCLCQSPTSYTGLAKCFSDNFLAWNSSTVLSSVKFVPRLPLHHIDPVVQMYNAWKFSIYGP